MGPGSATVSNAADVDDDEAGDDEVDELIEADGALSVSSSRLMLSLLSIIAATAISLST